jgi:protein arginine N-methyltransferase 3
MSADMDNHSGSENWSEDEESGNDETLQFVGLFDEEVFDNLKSMFDHCKEKNGFDVVQISQNLGL